MWASLTCLLLLACGVLSAPSIPSVRELDAATFTKILADPERDHLIFFLRRQPSAKPLTLLADQLSARLKLTAGSSIQIYVYDSARLGFPAGLHLHADAENDVSVVLFPAGGREPAHYDYSHDPLSPASAEGHHHGASASAAPGSSREGEEHDHHHASRPSLLGVLKWLKSSSTFPSEVPSLTLSELWEGREDGLMDAVLSGLRALDSRLTALKAENQRLQRELSECKAGSSTGGDAAAGAGAGGREL